MIKAIFWDNDGILVNTEHLYFEANRHIFKRFDIDITMEIFTEYSLVRGQSIFEFIEAKGYNSDYIEKLRQERDDYFAGLLKKNNKNLLIDGVPDALEKLHEKFLMAVVTSTRKRHFDIIHEHTGITRHFDFILTAENFENSKPHPEPYLKAFEKSGFKKSECLVVEDTERGLQAATAAGLKCIIIPNELTKGGKFLNAWKILKKISDMEDIVLSQSPVFTDAK